MRDLLVVKMSLWEYTESTLPYTAPAAPGNRLSQALCDILSCGSILEPVPNLQILIFHTDTYQINSSRGHITQRADLWIPFSTCTTAFPCQYHSTISAYSFIYIPHTLYNVFLPALQFSPVNIIPPLLHTHPSIYHPRCIMFFSQHFSFPLSVPFHHCSILIHL